MTYEARPGTIGHRAIEILRNHPPGAELSTAALCKALGIGAATLAPCLDAALRHGIVSRRKTSPRCTYWSLQSVAPNTAEQAEVAIEQRDARPVGAIERALEAHRATCAKIFLHLRDFR